MNNAPEFSSSFGRRFVQRFGSDYRLHQDDKCGNQLTIQMCRWSAILTCHPLAGLLWRKNICEHYSLKKGWEKSPDGYLRTHSSKNAIVIFSVCCRRKDGRDLFFRCPRDVDNTSKDESIWKTQHLCLIRYSSMYSARSTQVSNRIVMEKQTLLLEADQHKYRCQN